MIYNLKLDYTADELKELKKLSKAYNSPMTAVSRVVKTGVKIQPYEFLWRKYRTLDSHKEFDFMADINNAVMGTAIFPGEKIYTVIDRATGYVAYDDEPYVCWGHYTDYRAARKTRKEWLEINPAYEAMLEEVEE